MPVYKVETLRGHLLIDADVKKVRRDYVEFYSLGLVIMGTERWKPPVVLNIPEILWDTLYFETISGLYMKRPYRIYLHEAVTENVMAEYDDWNRDYD